MARTFHATLTAADRYERRQARRPKPSDRRLSTRAAIIRAAVAEVL